MKLIDEIYDLIGIQYTEKWPQIKNHASLIIICRKRAMLLNEGKNKKKSTK